MDMKLVNKAKSLYKWFKAKKSITYPVVGILVGISVGYLYYYYVGCNSGSCPITSSPWGSMGIGGLMGWLLVSK